ncbi:MAG: 5'/3'-nucleotidase SurE [Alphaproteobacteria bacterium]|nr:5'/3'-nucleotidase SurE [Alphaproteobacteria bacterium]
MSETLKNSQNCRILVTNDDGIYAPGIKVLRKIAEQLSSDVWVVAPAVEQSGAAHSLTLRRPLQVGQIAERQFFVDGTPTDCVLIAVNQILRDKKPDIVLSGVNRGTNIGEDITYSGTIAAAMESALLGIPSIALSQMRDKEHNIDWQVAEHYGPIVVNKLFQMDWSPSTLINVNFPNCNSKDVKGIRVVRQGRRASTIQVASITDPLGRPYLWIGDFTNNQSADPDTDLSAIHDQAISITPLHLDLTHELSLKKLKGIFS